MSYSINKFISVIIPVKKLSYYLLFENLPEFENQTYQKFEVIVVTNEHSQYDLVLLKKYRWLRIIPSGKVTRPAEKRNIGVKNAKGDILAFIDDDAFPRSDWLENAIKKFKKTIAAVCGPGILPENSDRWEKIFNQVVTSFLGSGGYSYRFVPEKQRFVDDYPSMNFLIKKKIFQKLGGFKGDFWPGEDSKLCEEIVYKEKSKILYSQDVVVYHHRRNSLKGFLQQHANYGFHRGAFFAHGDRNSRRISYTIPTLFTIYLLCFPVFFLLLKCYMLHVSCYIFSAPLILYLVFIMQLFFNALLSTKNIVISFLSPITLFLTHLTYGILFVKGIIAGLKNKENIYK